MRRAARTDRNQGEIVAALRQIPGCTVQPLSMVGHGVPNILVGWRGRNYLFEIKDPAQPPSKRQWTEDELCWHQAWRGQVCIIETVEDALKEMGI